MLTIRLDSDVPLVDQLVSGIRTEIAAERLAPGAELPPVRQLAADLGINLNTVARAYRVLQHSGLVHSARGRGTRVTSDRELTGEAKRSLKERLGEGARTLFADAKLGGLSLEEAKALMARELKSVWVSPARKA
ncbi:MAG: GntR family transcriptional regulator [Planctomycetota bacterium]|jgi:GntR family transcriptional regulator